MTQSIDLKALREIVEDDTTKFAMAGYRRFYKVPAHVDDEQLTYFPDWPTWLAATRVARYALASKGDDHG